MNKLTILVQGYAHPGKTKDSYIASPATVLIESKGKKILVDPGANSTLLLESFKKRHLTPEDIEAIFLSHYHLDHILNIRLFPKHKIYDGEMLWEEDREYQYGTDQKPRFIPGTAIEVMATPGHSVEHHSLLVKTDKGMICVAEDVWWWEDGQQKSDTVDQLMKAEDPFMTDAKALKKSRQQILKRADWIIPGHGEMFRRPGK